MYRILLILLGPLCCWSSPLMAPFQHDIPSSLVPIMIEAEKKFIRTVRRNLETNFYGDSYLFDDIFFSTDKKGTGERLSNVSVYLDPSTLAHAGFQVDFLLFNMVMRTPKTRIILRAEYGEIYVGNLTLELTELVISGIFGFHLENDKFISNHANFEYKPEQVKVNISYWVGQKFVDDTFLSDSIRGSLADPFFSEFTYQMNKMLLDYLNKALDTVSLSELIPYHGLQFYINYKNDFLKKLEYFGGMLMDSFEKEIKMSKKKHLGEFDLKLENGIVNARALNGTLEPFGFISRGPLAIAQLDDDLVLSAELFVHGLKLHFEQLEFVESDISMNNFLVTVPLSMLEVVIKWRGAKSKPRSFQVDYVVFRHIDNAKLNFKLQTPRLVIQLNGLLAGPVQTLAQQEILDVLQRTLLHLDLDCLC